jgi:nickel-dependent lactate racemase
MRRALAAPIGTLPLRELAQGRRDVAIAVDDISRPTPHSQILPYILEELDAAGIDESQVHVIFGVGTHRVLTRDDCVKKLGADLMDRLHTSMHNAYDNTEFLGYSPMGLPVHVNRDFMRADLKMVLGMLTPRGPYFGGGAKLILPGVCGRETVYWQHAVCDASDFRNHCDQVARMVGVDFMVNVMLSPELEIIGMVAGDITAAFEQGVEKAKILYGTDLPLNQDVAICNAWPKDNEGVQAGLGKVPLYGTGFRVVREGGTIVTVSACPEGRGWHGVLDPGGIIRGRRKATGKETVSAIPPVRQVYFSPYMNRYDIRELFGEHAVGCRTWDEVLATLSAHHGPGTRVSVFPYGALQYGRLEQLEPSLP